MMCLEQIGNSIRKNHLDNIFQTGFIDPEDNGAAEFVANTDQLFLQFGDGLVKIETIEQYSKISLDVVSDIQITIDFEDVIPAKSKIGNVIFKNPLIDNKVSKLVLFNMELRNVGVVCDAMKLILSNQQEIFFDPSFLGLNIGSSEVEELWRDNQKEESISSPTVITF
ncbi:hypothetical protein [Paenibacillus sp. QZ-Y1]|uniref:hypothetical protein n=1 Tax=Paenibacillus sp. QZ-Y1 TaxID=3414511 RepID=UPI003F7B0D4B